jgi:hypothetical protein
MACQRSQSCCNPNQKSADIPNTRDNRKAVSGVIERFLLIISFRLQRSDKLIRFFSDKLRRWFTLQPTHGIDPTPLPCIAKSKPTPPAAYPAARRHIDSSMKVLLKST